MKFILWSFFLLGLFLTGNADQKFKNRKSNVLEFFEKTKKAKEELEAFWKAPRAAKFDYLEKLAEQTLINMTGRTNVITAKIDELPEDGEDDGWMDVTEDIFKMDREIKKYYNTFLVEESKIRHLALAVLQCYEEDSRIPEAAEFVKKIHDFIKKGPEASSSDLMWITDPAKSGLYNEKLGDFLHARRTVELGEDEMDKKEAIMAKWEVANGRVLRAKAVVFNSLPIDTDERLNTALLNLAEFYRHKHRLRRFIDPSEDPDSFRYIAAGDRRLDAILLPVARRKNIHSEL